MLDPDVSSGSSPAIPNATPVSADAVMASMNSAEKQTWTKTGELPDRVKVKTDPTKSDDSAASSPARTDAASSPADPAAQGASTEASSESASETDTPPKKRSGHRGNAETRLQELLASDQRHREEIARLQGQVQALSSPRGTATADATSASSADRQPTQAEYQRYLAMPDAPNINAFTGENGLAEWTAAMSVFIADKRWSDHQGRASADAHFQTIIEGVQKVGAEARTRLQAHAQQHPDFAERVSPQLLEVPTATMRQLQGQPVGPQHVLAEELSKSPAIAPLLEFFSTPAGQAEWDTLCQKPYGDLMRAFERLEARFSTGSGTAAPPTKHVSSAPEPPTVLGSRASDTSDPVESAIRRKDVGAYIREANKRELAAMRSR